MALRRDQSPTLSNTIALVPPGFERQKGGALLDSSVQPEENPLFLVLEEKRTHFFLYRRNGSTMPAVTCPYVVRGALWALVVRSDP